MGGRPASIDIILDQVWEVSVNDKLLFSIYHVNWEAASHILFFSATYTLHHKPRYSICYVIHIGGFPSVRFWLCGVIEFSRYIGTWNTWYKVKISPRFASLAINPRRANLRAPNSAHNMICPTVCVWGGGRGVRVWVSGVNECVITFMFDRVLLSWMLEFVSLTSYLFDDMFIVPLSVWLSVSVSLCLFFLLSVFLSFFLSFFQTPMRFLSSNFLYVNLIVFRFCAHWGGIGKWCKFYSF